MTPAAPLRLGSVLARPPNARRVKVENAQGPNGEKEGSSTRCVIQNQFGSGRDRPVGGLSVWNVRYWPLADMTVCTAHVRFLGRYRV